MMCMMKKQGRIIMFTMIYLKFSHSIFISNRIGLLI